MTDLRYYIYFALGKMKRQFFRAYPEDESQYKKSLICAIICNACSSTASTLATGTFLVLLMTRLGMSDGNMGLILTFHNFANLAQLISIKISGRIVKNKLFVYIFEFQRALLGVLFFLPLFGWKDSISTTLLVIIYCYIQICVYICSPASIDWVDSLVLEEVRGSFYALRQSVTMIVSMVASFVMGILVDVLKDNHLELLFVILGTTIIIVQSIGMVAISMMKEKRTSFFDETGHEVVGSLAKKRRSAKEQLVDVSIGKEFMQIAKMPMFWKVLIAECLWLTGFALSASFNTSYFLNELNLSYTLISAFSFASCFIQSFLGPKFGKRADKVGTAKVTSMLVAVMACYALVLTFAVPKNGIIMYVISAILYAVAYSFVQVGILDLKLENFPKEKRIILLSYAGIISGVFTYFMCFVAGRFIDWFQAYALTKDTFIGYAQQYTNAVAFIIFMILTVYIQIVFRKKKGNE